MIQGSSDVGARRLSESEPHDEFLKLSALISTGSLTDSEKVRLREHLAGCPSCRKVARQYQELVQNVIPALAPTDFPDGLDAGPDWSEQQAQAAFFARLQYEEEPVKAHDDTLQFDSGFQLHPGLHEYDDRMWREIWVQYAAGILLMIGLGVAVYEIGIHRGAQLSRTVTPTTATQTPEAPLPEQLSDTGHEREIAASELAQREKVIAELKRELSRETSEVGRLKENEIQLEAALRESKSDRDHLAEEKVSLSQRVHDAEATLKFSEDRLDALGHQASQETIRTHALDAKVQELTVALGEQEQEVRRQQELLAHDRDIRDLMGARDLYIAEVYDVAGTGVTKKPYGRIFYTKGKSLVFYAYDLDQHSGFKNASTFQAWGRRGPDRAQAISLGIFYQDSAAKKRWVLKSGDADSLAQIDAVFVTVEPNGGSHLPSGKQLLFAYLRMGANHP